MTRPDIIRAVVAGLMVVAAAETRWVPREVVDAQANTTSLPVFEVDRGWPKVPPKWKVGDPSSFAVDSRDNIWLYHRPRTLKPEDAAMAAPPVMVFDTAGNFIKAWGGAGKGYEWPEREHGIHVDAKGFVWLTGNNCPTNGLPGLKPVADDLGLSPAQLAIAWVLQNDNVATAIIGASRPDQVHENVKAAGVRIPADAMARIDEALGDVVVRDPAMTLESSPKTREA